MKQQKTVGFILKRFDCNDGVASHCETLIRGLSASGWRVVMITGPVSYDSVSINRFEALKQLVEEWVIFERFNPLLPNLPYILKIQKTVKQYGISLFHVHGYSMLVVGWIFQVFAKLNCVATFHPSISGDDPKVLKEKASQVKNQQYKLYLRLFSPKKFIALSSDIATFLTQDLKFSEAKISKVLAGIDIGFFRSPTYEERKLAREKFGLQEEELVCALIGRLCWNKGHDILIDSVRLIRSLHSVRSIKCLFAGSGQEQEQIQEYAFLTEEDSLSFHFLGYMKDLREIYWAADVFVLPSRKEGFALVIAEAMSCGVVPIRTPAGGAQDQIEDGVNGFIIPFDDSENLAMRLKVLSNNVEFRKQLSIEAQKTAHQKFSMEKMVQDTIAVYEKVSL